MVILLSILNTEHCDLERLSHLVKPQNWACGASIQTHICMTPKSTQSFHIITPLIYLQCHESQKGSFQEKWSGPQCQMLQKGQGKVKLGAAPSTALIQDTTTKQRFAYCGQFQNKRMSHPFVMERRHLWEFLLEIPPPNLVVSKSQKYLS